MEAMQAEVDAIIAATPWVGVWLNWMMIVLLCSILFVWKHKNARWVLASMFAIMPTAVVIFNVFGNVNLVGASHIIFWIPLVTHIYKSELSTSSFTPKTPYGVWLILVTLTMVISLAFDFYDVAMVMLGHK